MTFMGELERLRSALGEAINHVTMYDDAIGHSYCDTQAEDFENECNCGFDDMIERWRVAFEGINSGETSG